MRIAFALLVIPVFPMMAWAEIILDQDQIDLGYIYRDEPQQVVFSFRNVSKDSTHFFDIEFSCDCTTAEIIPNPVPPNEDGRIVAYFDPMGYEKKEGFSEFIRVKTTDPASPEILVKFTGEVGIGPEPEPRSLRFGTLCRGESDTLKLVVKMPPKGDIRIVRAYTDTGCVVAKQSGIKNGSCQFDVIATNTAGCGRFAGFITIETTDPLRKEIRIPVVATFAGSIVIEPEVLVFGPTLPGTNVSQSMRVYSKENKPFGIKSVKSSVDALQPEVRKISPSSYEITIKIPNGSPAGRVNGVISVETECPDEPILEAEVTGYLREIR